MIFDRMVSERRIGADVTWTPMDDRWYGQINQAAQTFSGFPIDANTAKRVSAVFACTSLIAETIASLPCNILRRTDAGGKEKARDHRWFPVLRRKPNAWQSRMDFFSSQTLRLCLRGNMMARILDNGRSTPQLVPFKAEHTTIEQLDSGRLRYRHHDPKTGRADVWTQDEVLHVRDLSDDGIVGEARTALAREAIAVAAAGEAFVGGFFKNDATGRLLIERPEMQSKEKRQEFRQMIEENYAGYLNRSRAMIVSGGAKVSELGKHDDGGFIVDPRKFQVADVARYWRTPGFMIGIEEKSTSWGSGLEQQMRGYINFTLKSWADRITDALAMAIFTEDEQEEFLIEFNFDDLARGDLLTRAQSYNLFKGMGVLSPNEIREKENMGPRSGGDEYQENLSGAAPNSSGSTPSRRPPADDGEEASTIPAPLIADTVRRIVGAESRDIYQRLPADPAARVGFLASAYAGKRSYLAKILSPLFDVAGREAGLEPTLEQLVRSGQRAIVSEPANHDAWMIVRSEAVLVILEQSFAPALPVAA